MANARYKTLKHFNALLKDIDRGSFEGIGKPEPLKNIDSNEGVAVVAKAYNKQNFQECEHVKLTKVQDLK